MAKKPAEIPEHEQVILEPELEEALKNATDAEMCDIAGEAQTLWPERQLAVEAAVLRHPLIQCSVQSSSGMELGDLERATTFFDPVGPHLRMDPWGLCPHCGTLLPLPKKHN